MFDHGDEGYGLWLDGAVRDAAVYRTHWAGHREIVVRVTPDEIVIRRAGYARQRRRLHRRSRSSGRARRS